MLWNARRMETDGHRFSSSEEARGLSSVGMHIQANSMLKSTAPACGRLFLPKASGTLVETSRYIWGTQLRLWNTGSNVSRLF